MSSPGYAYFDESSARSGRNYEDEAVSKEDFELQMNSSVLECGDCNAFVRKNEYLRLGHCSVCGSRSVR